MIRATRRSAALGLAVSLAAATLPAVGGERPVTPEAAAAAREHATSDAAAARAEAGRARAQAASLANEATALSERLGQLGASIVARERRLEGAQATLERRRRAASAAQIRLAASREQLKRLLAAAERAAREPTAAILTQPDRPLDAARSAMLMRRFAETLARQRRQEREDAAAWRRAVDEAQQAEAALRADLEGRRAEEAEVARLRRGAVAARERALAEAELAQQRAERLGREAKDLRALERALAREADREAQRSRTEQAADSADAPASRTAPEAPRVADRPFSKAQGRLFWPAAGEMRRSGRKSEPGVSLFTRPYARVIAPWGGRVRYAESFKSEGKVVIIEPQKGYSILMTGLASVDVRAGQVVAAGEPLGRMGGPAQSSPEFLLEVGTGATRRSERLYVEIARNRRPLDPAPWFQPVTERVSGL